MQAELPGTLANIGTDAYPIRLVVTAMCADMVMTHLETLREEAQVDVYPKTMEFLGPALPNGDYTRVRAVLRVLWSCVCCSSFSNIYFRSAKWGKGLSNFVHM